MIQRTLLTGLLAGLAAGIVLTILYLGRIQPLLVLAEMYEGGADLAEHASFVRAVETFLFNLLAGAGYGLLLSALFTLRARDVGVVQGLLWGLAGFAALTLAPAFGLPPEVPGNFAAPLQDRQIWYVMTVASAVAGLALLVFAPPPALKILGVAVLALPHLIGAPQPEGLGGSPPPELAAQFVAASIGAMAVFWAVLGATAGWLYDRLGGPAADEAAVA